MTYRKEEIAELLLTIYKRLFEHYGPRNWWPADTISEMILGAILVQNVSWKNTQAALDNLAEKGLLSFSALDEVKAEELEELIRPARYYRTKARKLKEFARFVGEKYGYDLEKLLSLPLWSLRDELQGVYGIGEETADSIILYGSGQPIFVVDAYTRRIFQRLGFLGEKVGYQEMQEFFMKHLPPDVQLYNEYHALIDCLGNKLCRSKKPGCKDCPLLDFCCYAKKVTGTG